VTDDVTAAAKRKIPSCLLLMLLCRRASGVFLLCLSSRLRISYPLSPASAKAIARDSNETAERFLNGLLKSALIRPYI
jgi:hypothetical protein